MNRQLNSIVTTGRLFSLFLTIAFANITILDSRCANAANPSISSQSIDTPHHLIAARKKKRLKPKIRSVVTPTPAAPATTTPDLTQTAPPPPPTAPTPY